MKNVSWIAALVVGIVLGVAGDRMLGGPAGKGAPPPAPARPPTAAAPAAPPVEDPKAVYRVPVDDAPLRGSAGALVTIVLASDFQCPYCKRVEPTLQALEAAFPGKVRVAWKHQPLEGHAKALPAAIAAEEARAQGGNAKFWAMHDKLFELAPALDRPDLERAAQEVGIDVAGLRAALDQGKHKDRIERDQALMQRLGASSTPTLFVNGRKVVGAVPMEQLKPVVEEELRKAEALVASGVAPKDVYARLQEKAATALVYLPAGAGPAAGAPPRPAPPALGTAAAKVTVRRDDPMLGKADAPVTIVVFSDFQCPYCARVEPTLKQLRDAFPGAVRVAWKHMPLPPTMHPQAKPAAEAAEAAREQGKFWEMHDKLFASQRALAPELYESAARELGLDVARFKQSMAAHAGAARIEEDQKLAGAVGASATPTLFVNCRRIAGAYPFENVKPVVEEELRKAEALAKQGKSGAALFAAACDENVRKYGSGPAAGAGAVPAIIPGGRAAVPVRQDDPAKGRAGAPVMLVLFSDFQCPYCARASPALKEIESAYPKDVRVVWKHYPLSFHKNAMPAALAAEAARAQGGAAKFWAMHDKLFANQGALSDAAYQQYARELGLDVERFRRDVASPALRARIDEDQALAQKLGVSGTPTFVVNGERVVGAGPLRAAVERQLAKARGK